MFWNIVLMVLALLVCLVLGYSVGKSSILANAKIGVYDVVNNALYFDKDISANSLENEGAEIGVVDLVYLSNSRKAKGGNNGELSE